MCERTTIRALLLAAVLSSLSFASVRAEVMLQWFNTTWNEMTEKMPILAEIGYGSIYIPVPNKGGSQYSVGYDLHDRFDLGDEDQNGTIATKYGTKHDLVRMVETAHRFGIRIYFDNVMNHNSFGVPGYDENTPIDLYPDMLPEDFHLIQTDNYYWRKSGAIEGYHYDTGDHQAIQHYTLSDLTDISNEAGNWDIPGPDLSFVRQPTEPDKYPDTTDVNNFIQDADGHKVYKYNDADRSTGDPTSEDVNGYLIRAARWTMHETKCDGFRFDAAKHVVPYFFGSWKDAGNWGDYLGYCGGIQAEYDIIHGFTDGDTRNSLFDEDAPRDDAMLFGEVVPHNNLDLYDYVRRGMRLLDFDYEGIASSTLDGYGDQKYCGSLLNMGRLGPDYGVMQPMNHDHPQFADMDLLQTYMVLRDGMPLIYTDGNNHSLPDKWGRVFPEQGSGDFLGQYQNPNIIDRLPDLMHDQNPESEITRAIWIHEQFGRGQDYNKWADDDVVVNQKRYQNDYKGTSYDQNEGALLLIAANNDSYSQETHYVNPFTDFRPQQLLYNYATRHNWMDQDEWVRVNADWTVNLRVPPGHYSAYSLMIPGKTKPAWNSGNPVDPILIEQPAGVQAPWMPTYRSDGTQGDTDWDDDGIPNDEDGVFIPRVTGSDDLRFVSLSDGLTAVAMIRLDEGLDVDGNGLGNSPGNATDVYLGFEPMSPHFKRHGSTYFYDRDTAFGDPFFAITSDMDDTTGDGTGNEDDFWVRHEYEAEYDAAGISATNFAEGYHMARTRLFRRRGDANYWHGCDLFNTFKQTFYMDQYAPTGTIVYPKPTDGYYSREYGMVFRSDDTVTKVLVHIDDDDPTNDDNVTGEKNGNGISTNGVDDAWVAATRATPNIQDPQITQFNDSYPREWRFTYRNIPSIGDAVLSVQLHEASSEVDPARITTLVQTNGAHAPDARLQITWPQNNSVIEFTDYEMVVQFTDCTDGGSVCLDKNTDRFSLFIDNAFQPRNRYWFQDNQPGDQFGELRFAWSNFSAGVHTIMARYEDTTYNLETVIEVETTVERTEARIIDPPPFDFDGNTYVITAPYPPPPFSYEVLAETSEDVIELWVDIDAGEWAGDATAIQTNSEGKITWSFDWDPIPVDEEGSHVITIFAHTAETTDAAVTSVRPIVDFRQTLDDDPADNDDDDDGLTDTTEIDAYDLFTDKPDPLTWSNGDVHLYNFSGKTDPLSPDSDDDGLSDATELGLGGPIDAGATDLAADTDGDGFPNHRADVDPPVYNTDDNSGHPEYVPGGDRLMQIDGSTTNPNNPDTDGDGIYDGVEDDNNNGVIEANDRNGRVDAGETDPNDGDTDGDGKGDGNEDWSHDGVIDGDADNDRQYDAGEAWTETDPLNPDTDGDGLPDGWENRHCLSALDDGTDNLQTSAPGDGHPDHGADGDPDGDGLTNLAEFTGNTDPCFSDQGLALPGNKITIGGGEAKCVLGGVQFFEQFTDWTADDCHALDETQPTNAEDGDVYQHGDGFDSSRDIVAFYSRDGRDLGEFYFRVDFQDLQYLAEEGSLDFYIVIDTGNPATGEVALPDNVNCGTAMQWELVVAVYESGFGSVYIDHDPIHNTENSWDDLFSNGVAGHGEYFVGASYRADYDAVEIAISRQALFDAGWNGISALGYQVYTVRDGTQDDPRGEGDIGGASDITDAMWDDERGTEDGMLDAWMNQSWKANPVKLALLVHGNQAALPASDIQELLYHEDGAAPAGYFRLLDAHECFGLPVNLHISGTLASAIEWAASDTDPNRDGPAFNDRITRLSRDGLIYLVPGPYADHFLTQVDADVNQAAYELGEDVLNNLYETDFPQWWDTYWIPERVMDGTTLTELAATGRFFGILDQWTHLFNWFGRDAALKADGYKLNEINGMKMFPINQLASDERFQHYDGGLTWGVRSLLAQKAQETWARDQVVVLFSEWFDFADPDKAAAYDQNLAWIANHPWINVVTFEQIVKGEIDTTGDDSGDFWGSVNHGAGLTLSAQAKDYINHAANGDVNRWYDGVAGEEESLRDEQFEYEPGRYTSKTFGPFNTGNTIVRDTWNSVDGAGTSREGLLGRMIYFSGLWETGFHDEDELDRTRWSYGAYKNPDTTYDALSGFAKVAQAHAREAQAYASVASWAASLPNGSVVAMVLDIDHDGEMEQALWNDRVYGIFEDNGGRMVAAFVRDPDSGRVFQALGNTGAYPDGETEEEGIANVDGSGKAKAKRTSALKDWWAGGLNTSDYINKEYLATPLADGWQFESVDHKVRKTITLAAADSSSFTVDYEILDPGITRLYIRNGLSPNLYDLMRFGQKHLGTPAYDGSVVTLVNDNHTDTVAVALHCHDGAHNTDYEAGAADHAGQFASRNMRNQAYVHQVELSGGGQFTFQIELQANRTDTDGDNTANEFDSDDDGDGFDDDVELMIDPLTGEQQSDPWDNSSTPQDDDGDGLTNAEDPDDDGDGMDDLDEIIAGTDPADAGSQLGIYTVLKQADGKTRIEWTTVGGKRYTVGYAHPTPGVGLVWQEVPADTFQVWETDVPSGPGNEDSAVFEDDGSLTGEEPICAYRVFVHPD